MKNRPGKKTPRAEFSTQNVEEHKNSLSVKKKNRNTKGVEGKNSENSESLARRAFIG